MSYCECDYEIHSVYRKDERTARKERKCSECRRAIKPKERYEHVFAIWSGMAQVFDTCCRCLALKAYMTAHLPCFCYAHTTLLDDAREAWDSIERHVSGSGMAFELGRLAVAIKRAPFVGSAPKEPAP